MLTPTGRDTASQAQVDLRRDSPLWSWRLAPIAVAIATIAGIRLNAVDRHADGIRTPVCGHDRGGKTMSGVTQVVVHTDSAQRLAAEQVEILRLADQLQLGNDYLRVLADEGQSRTDEYRSIYESLQFGKRELAARTHRLRTEIQCLSATTRSSVTSQAAVDRVALVGTPIRSDAECDEAVANERL